MQKTLIIVNFESIKKIKYFDFDYVYIDEFVSMNEQFYANFHIHNKSKNLMTLFEKINDSQ